MSIEVRVPDLGDGIESGDVLEVLVAEGDQIEKEQGMVELETDKASMDLPAPVAGVVTKILKQNGDDAEIGETIALIDEDAQPAEGKKQTEAPGKLPEPLIIMPAAQRLTPDTFAFEAFSHPGSVVGGGTAYLRLTDAGAHGAVAVRVRDAAGRSLSPDVGARLWVVRLP